MRPFEAKLQGGPGHGKVTTAHHTSFTMHFAKANPINYFTASTDELERGPVFNHRTCEYRMLIAPNPLDPDGPRIPCVNHKGQVLFQFVKE